MIRPLLICWLTKLSAILPVLFTALAIPTALAQDCNCESEQEVKINLRGVAYFAGAITVQVTTGDEVQTTSMVAGSVNYDTEDQRYYAAAFGCA